MFYSDTFSNVNVAKPYFYFGASCPVDVMNTLHVLHPNSPVNEHFFPESGPVSKVPVIKDHQIRITLERLRYWNVSGPKNNNDGWSVACSIK